MNFRTAHLFYLTAVIAAAIAVGGIWGVFWAAAVISIWLWVYDEFGNNSRSATELATHPKQKQRYTIFDAILVGIVGICF